MIIGKLRIILEYLLIFCIIIEFYTPYTVLSSILRTIQFLPIFILLILIFISRYSINHKENLYILIYLIGAVFPLLSLPSSAYQGFILRYILLLPLLWMYIMLRKRFNYHAYLSIFLKYSNTVTFIAFISTIMWLLCSVLQIIPPTAIIPFEWGDRTTVSTYLGIYFETQSTSVFGLPSWRNSGIFNEAPMYNMILCAALSIEAFIRPKTSKIRIWILILTILTTQTTTGQLFLILIAGWYIYKKINKRHRILLTILAPLLLIGGYFITNSIIDNKIKEGGDTSVNDRTEDIMICLEVGMEHPCFGIGLVTSKDNKLLWQGKDFGFSNSLFAVFARGGLYGLTLYVAALILIPYCFYMKYKDYRWFFTMFCFFIVFSFTNSYAKYLTFLFLAWGLSNINLKKGKII